MSDRRHQAGIDSVLPRPRRRRPPSIRARLGRRLTLRRVLAVVVAIAITAGVDRLRPAPESPLRASGPRIELAVAMRDLASGERIGEDAVRFVSVDAAVELAGGGVQPIGRQLTQPVAVGEIILDRDVGATGRNGLQPGERAVAVARSTSPLPLESDDRVELIAVAASVDGFVRSEVLGPPVRVLSVDADSVVLAVPAALAPVVVERQAGGAIEVVLTP